MERVFIASCGLVKVGKLKEKGIGDLMAEASLQAMRQRPELIPDRVIVGNMFSGVGSRQEHLGAYLSTLLGLGNIPAYKVEAACGSGGVAVHNAYLAIKSGESSAVLVTGVEKMTDLDVNEATSALAMADNQEFGASLGATFTSLNALTYRMYLDRYAAKPEELAEFPVLSHKNALNSPHAMFKKMIQVEDVVNSPIISDPIRLLDSSPLCDGAASLLIVNEEIADRLKGQRVEILSSEVAVNQLGLAERQDPLDYTATRSAAKRALEKSGVKLGDFDFMEIHDAFSITSALTLESIGLCEKGRAGKEAQRGRFEIKGELPINTFGGLKARGHPVGASGVYEIAEAYLQLSGQAGLCQVPDARIGLTHNMGGVDTTTVITILRGGV
ncbi:MAG: beta-ketoacyl synthase N-terminal-like domain-containing protein [Conexivisphaerales archaeon]